MSTQINDGGPAFPGGVNSIFDNIDQGEPTQSGMPLRDYFAAKALQGAMVNATGLGELTKADRDEMFNGCAGLCYEAADAMLRAREVQP